VLSGLQEKWFVSGGRKKSVELSDDQATVKRKQVEQSDGTAREVAGSRAGRHRRGEERANVRAGSSSSRRGGGGEGGGRCVRCGESIFRMDVRFSKTMSKTGGNEAAGNLC
jgi:hypothetical protein